MKPKSIGYIKLDGALVADGILDARKSAMALIGADHLLKSILIRKVPELKDINFDLPVFIEEGSIVINFPENIEKLIIGGAIALPIGKLAYNWANEYLKTAGKKMAEHDFKDAGLSTIIQGALGLAQDVVKLAKHTGKLGTKQFPESKPDLEKQLVAVPGISGNVEYFHRSVLDEYSKFNALSFRRLGELVQVDRELVIGIIDGERNLEERITQKEKYLFVPKEEQLDNILFPNFVHDLPVTLDGETTRGTLTTNSVGFLYDGHILTCHPREGSIIRFRDSLFTKCTIMGVIDRHYDSPHTIAKKPQIIFDSLDPIEPPNSAPSLFPAT